MAPLHRSNFSPSVSSLPLALLLGASVSSFGLLSAHAQEAPVQEAPTSEVAPTVPKPVPAIEVPPATTTPAPRLPLAPLALPPLASPPVAPPVPADPATPIETPSSGTAIDRVPGEREGTATPTTPAMNTKKGKGAIPAKPANSQLSADNFRVENGVVVASANAGRQVQFENGPLRLSAGEIRLNTTARTTTVPGEVLVERSSQLRRRLLDARGQRRTRYTSETGVDTLRGDNFTFNFGNNTGTVDNVRLVASNLNVNAKHVDLTDKLYTAHDVVVRPGGLSPEEMKIYGRPPFSLHAKRAVITAPEEGSEDPRTRVAVSGAGFYVGGTRLFPVPSALLGRSVGGRDQQAFSLTPRASFSSADGVLITTQLAFALDAKQPEKLQLVTDLGLSQRVGFRGGASVQSTGNYGRISVGGLVNDVVTTQLTNRIELDRLPEASYRTPLVGLFNLPGGRRAGIQITGIVGRYRESTSGGGSGFTDSRTQLGITLTTRKRERDGLYGELFARTANYGSYNRNYSYSGFEVGYTGKLLPRVVGQVSYRTNDVDGDTPFLFDRVQIRQEIRTTFDVGLSPRYILPFDLRYDVNRASLRDAKFGLLRSYKTFAYGLTYQTARNELRLDFRQAF